MASPKSSTIPLPMVQEPYFRLDPHSLLVLYCCCLHTDVCLFLFLTCWMDLDECWTWLGTLNLSEGHWNVGTTYYCQHPYPACHTQVPQGWAFLGKGSALLLVGSPWLLAHPFHGAVLLLEAIRDPEHMGCGSSTADRTVISDSVHHCHWMSAKSPLRTSYWMQKIWMIIIAM